MKRFLVHFDEEQMALLKIIAKNVKASRALLIRELIKRGLETMPKAVENAKKKGG